MAHKTGAAFENGHIIHGAANAMYLGKVIQWNSKDPRAAERYAYVAKEILHLPGETNEEEQSHDAQEMMVQESMESAQNDKSKGDTP